MSAKIVFLVAICAIAMAQSTFSLDRLGNFGRRFQNFNLSMTKDQLNEWKAHVSTKMPQYFNMSKAEYIKRRDQVHGKLKEFVNQNGIKIRGLNFAAQGKDKFLQETFYHFLGGVNLGSINPVTLTALTLAHKQLTKNLTKGHEDLLGWLATKTLLLSNCLRDVGGVLMIVDSVVQDPSDIQGDIFMAIFLGILGYQTYGDCQAFWQY